jgi:hypothetical protein
VSLIDQDDGALGLAAQMHEETGSGLTLEAVARQSRTSAQMSDEAEGIERGHGCGDDVIGGSVEAASEERKGGALAATALSDEHGDGVALKSEVEPVDDMVDGLGLC